MVTVIIYGSKKKKLVLSESKSHFFNIYNQVFRLFEFFREFLSARRPSIARLHVGTYTR